MASPIREAEQRRNLAFPSPRSASFGGRPSSTLPGGIVGSGGGALASAARLASSQPGLSRSEFEAQLTSLAPEGGFVDFDLNKVFGIYKQLTSPTGTSPETAEDVTSPEPEGPGRFGATRPGDLLGASALRFGA